MSHPLEERLNAEGIACRVEARERLAVLIPVDANVTWGIEDRSRAIRLAREAGFSHVSVELDPAGATLSRD
jgi:hypothetical protein